MATIKTWKGKAPQIGKNVFLAEGSHLLGDVTLADECSVFPSVVLRGDINYVKVGRGTNIQDNTTFHVADNYGVEVGEDCVIGHNAVVHACKIGNNVTVGMGAIVMDGAEIGDKCMIAAGSLVPPRKVFEPGMLIVGSPAKAKRPLTDDEIAGMVKMAEKYRMVKDEYIRSEQESE